MRAAVGVAVLTSVLLAACTRDSSRPPQTTVAQVTTTTAAPRRSDGMLRIGVLLPITGQGAAPLGNPLREAINGAIEAINGAGGVIGSPVAKVEADEADDNSLAHLLESGVDAIVGPASSLVALSELGQATSGPNAVVVCSPTATAQALDDFPDNSLFFRTVPSDSLQMAAIAGEARRTGTATVAVAYLDDPYGRGLRRSLTGTITQTGGLELVGDVGFSGDQENLTEAAEQVIADNPGVVVVLADADDGGRFLAALGAAVDRHAADGGSRPWILVNDTVRTAREAISGLSNQVRTRLRGVAPRSQVTITVDGAETTLAPFAAHAADCVNLIALAVSRAQSDRPTDFARSMSAVSVGGSPCRGFAECSEQLARGLQIDYLGLSGAVDLRSLTGDLSRATFEVFGFSADGTETSPNTREVSY